MFDNCGTILKNLIIANDLQGGAPDFMRKVTVFYVCYVPRHFNMRRIVFIRLCFCTLVPRFHLNFIKTCDGSASLGIAMSIKITLALRGTTMALTAACS